jgi:hypothetical protein
MRQLTEAAQAAKLIRQTLKQYYPSTTFAVHSSNFANGNAVDINWIDGPTTREIDKLVSDFQQGHFDGMVDMYEYSNDRDDIPQAKYVQTQREMSEQVRGEIVDEVNKKYGYNLKLVNRGYGWRIDPDSDAPRGNCSGWQSDDVGRIFNDRSY